MYFSQVQIYLVQGIPIRGSLFSFLDIECFSQVQTALQNSILNGSIFRSSEYVSDRYELRYLVKYKPL